jgi:two-component system, chemotaxis family, protein-glutamate methylesterase/glutaminase
LFIPYDCIFRVKEETMNAKTVVVGASAGGVEALQVLMRGLPADFPAPVLVVLHIPPHSPSQLPAVLAHAGVLPVTPARDGEVLRGGHVYVAPPDRHLLVEGKQIRVTRGPKENRMRPAIDPLFRSAAYSLGANVIGIILSGLLDDGTAGLWAIKDRGGIALVQSPEEALACSMPRSAIEHVAVDYILPVAAMPSLLTRLAPGSGENLPLSPSSERMQIETRIAAEDNALEGTMQLGSFSPNTCPECHGVLVKIEEGSIVRYRCHTGHAYSLQTLLSEVNEKIDTTLWNALRVIEERILLLREMEQAARTLNDTATAEQCAEQADATERQTERVRELVLNDALFGRTLVPREDV